MKKGGAQAPWAPLLDPPLVTDDGAVYSWGNNSNGCLGLQNSSSSVVAPSPIQNGLESVRITHVSCGKEFSLALSDNGEVVLDVI